jgi:citrate lyase subunit beta/citryl-CoA lyase
LAQIETTAGRGARPGVEALIESAADLLNVEAICCSSPRLEAVHFGGADFAASLEMPLLAGGVDVSGYPGDPFHYPLGKFLIAGRANGLQVVDGPYLNVRDVDGFRTFATRSHLLGFDGKWVLHPDQVNACNEIYTGAAPVRYRPRP